MVWEQRRLGVTRIDVLSSYNPILGFQGGPVRHTTVKGLRKYDMDCVTILPTHYDPYELIFHAYKEENCIDTLSFIGKSFNSDKSGKN